MNADIIERAKKVKLLALDADGVLTDGGVYVLDDGREFRRFDIKDGLGIKRAMAAGIQVAIISSSACEAVQHRAATLGIDEVHIGVADKLAVLLDICQRLQLTLDQVAYMGDDLVDLPILERVGLPCAPADAAQVVKDAAYYIASSGGGKGAVREIADALFQCAEAADKDSA